MRDSGVTDDGIIVSKLTAVYILDYSDTLSLLYNTPSTIKPNPNNSNHHGQ